MIGLCGRERELEHGLYELAYGGPGRFDGIPDMCQYLGGNGVEIREGEFNRMLREVEPHLARLGVTVHADVDGSLHLHTSQEAAIRPEPKLGWPAIANAKELLHQIETQWASSERNHEQWVRDMLVGLGHEPTDIEYRVGHIDVLLRASKPIVFEVKRSLSRPSEHASALRQGFDYAARSSATLVVVTDGDRYEVFDRARRGTTYEHWHVGSFRLSRFHEQDAAVLGRLRPFERAPRYCPRVLADEDVLALIAQTVGTLSPNEYARILGRRSHSRLGAERLGAATYLPPPPPIEQDWTLRVAQAAEASEQKRVTRRQMGAGGVSRGPRRRAAV